MGAPPGAAAASELNTSSQGDQSWIREVGCGEYGSHAPAARAGGGWNRGDQGLGPP